MNQKFLDESGVVHLYNKLSLNDYPNNETLMAVITAIDETKANKEDLIQSNWNQNDINQLDYIKNKPFYTEDPVKTIILEEETLTVEDSYAYFTNGIALEVGETYFVNFNGVEYECIAWQDIYQWGPPCIGNSLILGFEGYGNDEPFAIDYLAGDKIQNTLNTKEAGEYTVFISKIISPVKQIDSKYIPHDSAKMDTENPVGSGSFSMNRKEATKIGHFSHAEGFSASASGFAAHAEGLVTIASGDYSHVQGSYNIEDTENKYLHIVGNGGGYQGVYTRSNAHTLDWEGNAWYQGNVYVGSTSGINKDNGSIRLARVNEIPVISDWAKASAKPTYTYDEVGADQSGSATEALVEAKTYTDTAIAALVNSAPETLDTLGELATAFEENADMVATLDAAVTNKAEKTDLDNLADLVDINATNIESLQKQVLPTSLILADAITGESYTIQIQNGQLVSFKTGEV